MHPLARLPLVLLLLVSSMLVVAGCGGDGDEAGSTGVDSAAERDVDDREADEPQAADPGTQATASLRVRIENVGSKDGAGLPVPAGIACDRSLPATCQEQVTCPVEADDPDAPVCAWLATPQAGELLLEDPPERQVCTEQYGGPEVATVTGALDGDQVDATFSRQDGCAIGRYDAVMPLWTGEFTEPDMPPAPSDGPPADPDAPVSSDDPEPDVIDDPPEAFQ